MCLGAVLGSFCLQSIPQKKKIQKWWGKKTNNFSAMLKCLTKIYTFSKIFGRPRQRWEIGFLDMNSQSLLMKELRVRIPLPLKIGFCVVCCLWGTFRKQAFLVHGLCSEETSWYNTLNYFRTVFVRHHTCTSTKRLSYKRHSHGEIFSSLDSSLIHFTR